MMGAHAYLSPSWGHDLGLAAVPAEGWQAGHRGGRVIVLPDRSEVKVCDGKVDDRVHKAVWMNRNGIDARADRRATGPG